MINSRLPSVAALAAVTVLLTGCVQNADTGSATDTATVKGSTSPRWLPAPTGAAPIPASKLHGKVA
jgi:hypothetical protein